jgi:hypothetical protein
VPSIKQAFRLGISHDIRNHLTEIAAQATERSEEVRTIDRKPEGRTHLGFVRGFGWRDLCVSRLPVF